MDLSLTEREIHTVNDFFDFLTSYLLYEGDLPHELQDKLTIYLDNLKTRNRNSLGQISIADANKVANDKILTLKALAESTVSPTLHDNYRQGDKILRSMVNTAHELLTDLKSIGGDSLADVLNAENNTNNTFPVNTPVITDHVFTMVYKEFINERMIGNNWDTKTRDAYQTTFNLFRELFGDISVETIKVKESRDFKSQIQLIPRNHAKVSAYRDKSVKQLVALDIPVNKRISVESANKHIARMSSFLNWCKQQGYVAENPFVGMQIRTTKSKLSNRNPFSIDDLNKLFNDAIYSSGKMKHSYYFWLPLIALYSGARIQEICQLELRDIRKVDDILVFDVNGNASTKRLKNLNSKRLIPVHQDLITLGFDRLLKRRTKQKQKHLFPELHIHASGREGQSQPASKWFGRYKAKHGFALDGIKAFHSFRHTFVEELKNKNTPEHITAALAGHNHENITYGTYGGKTLVEVLKLHIHLIEYRGFNKDKIKWFPN